MCIRDSYDLYDHNTAINNDKHRTTDNHVAVHHATTDHATTNDSNLGTPHNFINDHVINDHRTSEPVSNLNLWAHSTNDKHHPALCLSRKRCFPERPKRPDL